MNSTLRLIFWLLPLTVLTVVLLWNDRVPLGFPGEWTWGRHSYRVADLAWSTIMGGAGLLAYVLFVMWGDRCPAKTMAACSLKRTRNSGWLLGLVVAGFAWLWMAQSLANPQVGLAKGPWIIYSHSASGYYLQARYEVSSTSDFLANYESLVSGEVTGERDVLHLGTHPPGLTVVLRGLISLFQKFPALTDAVNATQPTSVSKQIEYIRRESLQKGRPFDAADSATLWGAFLLVQLSSALTVVPLYHWLRQTESRITSWRACALWPLVPAVAIFLPKSDTMFPMLAMTAGTLWRKSWRENRPFLGFLAGAVLWVSMCFSLAFLVVGVWLIIQTLLDGKPGSANQSSRPEIVSRSAAIQLGVGAFGFLLPIGLTWWGTGMNLVSVWHENYLNHALFYTHYQRSYVPWLLLNPFEISLAVGLPVMLAVVVSLRKTYWGVDERTGVRRLAVSSQADIGGAWGRSTAIPATFFVLGLLWITGKNSGEAARLWILFFPWIVACTAPCFRAANATLVGTTGSISGLSASPMCEALADRPSHWRWGTFLLAQGVISLATVLKVDGFHLSPPN
ncbi:MAG: hypothetical protein R3C01_12040 [Planctomycetaceae bacterium]